MRGLSRHSDARHTAFRSWRLFTALWLATLQTRMHPTDSPPLCLAALAHDVPCGAHVLIEKPMALQPRELRERLPQTLADRLRDVSDPRQTAPRQWKAVGGHRHDVFHGSAPEGLG
jgi:hypothetical protein